MKYLQSSSLSLLLLILTVVISQAQPRKKQPAQPFSSLTAAKDYLQQQAKKHQFSGVVMVSSDKGVQIQEAYGMANFEKEIENNIDTKINIGSINKAFTKVCVMQLFEQGLIRLEDNIVDYIPELTAEMANEITILNLLEMKSGLGSYHHSDLFQARRKELRNIVDYIPIIAALELDAKPGTKRQYSNASYELLGILVQRVSGQNYYDYVRENVYKKAGMINTDAYERDASTANLAQGYSQYEYGESLGADIGTDRVNKFTNNVNDWHAVKGTAAGGGYSTVADLHRFVIALNNNQLVSETSTNLIINRFRNQVKRSQTFRMRGGSYGINAHVSFDQVGNKVVIVLSNFDPPTASDLAERLEETANE